MAFVYWIHLDSHTDPKTEGYVGITGGTVEDRFISHKRKANRDGKLIIHHAIRKYGSSIRVTTLLEAEKEFCELVEWAYRDKPNVGWNLLEGGCPLGISVTRSDETKKKMGESRKGERHHYYGKKLSEEHRRKMSDSHKGRIVSPESCKKLSESLTGREFTDEHKAAISAAAKRKNPWQNATANKIIWQQADQIYAAFQTGIKDSSLAHMFGVNHNKIAAISRKLKAGWNPLEDENWLAFKASYEKELYGT